MKRLRHILSVMLVFLMLFSNTSFAASAPGASIVSPAANSVASGSDLLISVKVSDKKKISVTVFEERRAVADKDGKESFEAVDVKELSENALDLLEDAFNKSSKNFEDAVFEKGKATGSFVIEEKEERIKFTELVVSEPASYTAVGEAGYFSKNLEKLSPGLYRVQVQLLDKDGEAVESYSSLVALKENKTEAKADATCDKAEPVQLTPETQKANLVQSVVKIFKSIIK